MDQAVKPWRRLAVIFPGQGSQHVGMGEQLAKVSRAARQVFERADEILEYRISKLCFEGPAEELESTVNQQPATFVTSIAWFEALKDRLQSLGKTIEPHVVAGHSMGEFTAAVAAGSLTFEEGLLLVKDRGMLMEEAGKVQPGGMASVLGLSEAQVSAICEEASSEGYIGLATANCEGQNVISGALKPLARAMELAEAAGARKVVRLSISIASHSPLMALASEGMDARLRALPIRDPETAMIGNISAARLETRSEVYAELREQLTSGVMWHRSVDEMRAEGIDMFMEAGPGNVLTRLVRRIDYEVNSLSLSDEYDGLLSDNFAVVEAAAQ